MLFHFRHLRRYADFHFRQLRRQLAIALAFISIIATPIAPFTPLMALYDIFALFTPFFDAFLDYFSLRYCVISAMPPPAFVFIIFFRHADFHFSYASLLIFAIDAAAAFICAFDAMPFSSMTIAPFFTIIDYYFPASAISAFAIDISPAPLYFGHFISIFRR